MPAKIAVVVHSLWGHINTLAQDVVKGLQEAGAEVKVFQFPETLSEEILAKMHANKSLTASYPVITPNDLKEFDGFLFGFGTRYGRAPAQASAFFDATGGLWASGALVGKFAGIFTSTASQHGGQETTALSTIPFFAHQGIIFVPIGFAAPEITDLTEIVGGSAYGAATMAGADGSRQVTAKELSVARFQGKHFGTIVNQFVAGKK